jgi:catalase
MENEPSFLFDGLVVPDGLGAVEALGRCGQTAEYVQNQYRHCKPILALGTGAALLDGAGASRNLPNGEPDEGIVVADDDLTEAITRFIDALSQRRNFARETDPPRV